VGSLHYVTDHCADVFFDNVQMVTNLYKAVQKKHPKSLIVNPIANCGYPPDDSILFEKNFMGGDVHPSVYAYGHSRRCLLVASKMYRNQYEIRSNNLLIPNAFGPGDSWDPNRAHAINGMVIRLIKAKKNNDNNFVIWGTGKPIREWAYVDDISRLLILSINHQESIIEPVNFGQGVGVSIYESAKTIAEIIEYKGGIKFDESIQDGTPKKIMDSKRFNATFPGFQFMNHKKGLVKTIKYYWELI
jgi:GDP-L-fucose synthase